MTGLQEIVPLGVAILDRSIVTHKVTPTHDTRRRILPRARAAVRSTTPMLLAKLLRLFGKKNTCGTWTCLPHVFFGSFLDPFLGESDQKLWFANRRFDNITQKRANTDDTLAG